MKLSRAARRWEQTLARRAAEALTEERPRTLVVPIPGRQDEAAHLVTAAEVVLVEWGYRLDRTELPYDPTRGVQAYALFVRAGDVDERPTTGWLT